MHLPDRIAKNYSGLRTQSGKESSIIVTGTVKEDTRSSIGVELDVTGLGSFRILTNTRSHQRTRHRFLMDHRHLWIRSKKAARCPKGPTLGDPGDP
ncbi:MAG: hypothetical protein R2682_01615 [Pyrinomonadaceae bacterium]